MRKKGVGVHDEELSDFGCTYTPKKEVVKCMYGSKRSMALKEDRKVQLLSLR